MRKPKWFVHYYPDAPDDWNGPHATIEAAIQSEKWEMSDVLYAGKGRKLTKAEIEEMGVEYDWEVDTTGLLEIRRYEKKKR